MKRITNINDPNNVIIVSDAYINGDRIVCITEEDEFDLWRNCWKLEDLPKQSGEGLEEAAEKWATTTHFEWLNQVPAGKKGFIAGAKWMAQHGVKAKEDK